jgi:membrane-associated phospholipid phosphatase
MLTRRIWSYRAEIAFWSLWLAAVGAFVALAAWADHRYTLPLDRRVTFGIQELYRYTWATRFFETINTLGSQGTITLVLFVAFAFALVRGLRYEALMIAGTGAVRFVQLGVRSFVHRPDAEFLALRANLDGLQRPQFYPDASGFPSGHVFGATIVYGLLFAYAPRALTFKPLAALVRAFCVFEIALIGPARMYVGAHWFSDVVGAALLAGIYLALAWKLDGMISHIRALAVERNLAVDAGLSAGSPESRRFARAVRPAATATGAEEPQREPRPATR